MRKLKKILANFIPFKNLRHKVKFALQIYGQKNNIEGSIPEKVNVQIYGNNNSLIFGSGLNRFSAKISIGEKSCPVNDCVVKIDDNSTADNVDLRLFEDGSRITIGKECMFSSRSIIWCSDTHAIINRDNEVTNIGKSVEIGDHVWIGMDVKIGKNTKIANNSVVGWGSVVTRKFDKEGIVIAGNPAVEVKEDINWSRLRPKEFLMKQK